MNIRNAKKFKMISSDVSIEFWFGAFEKDMIILDAPYQREYVWTEKEQQAFLMSVIQGLPLSVISVVKNYDHNGRTKYEVVDGRQRLTTLKMFFEGKISLNLDGEKVLFPELSMSDQLYFLQFSLTRLELEKASEKEKIEYFLRLNFGGVPQEEAHRQKVEKMLESLK